MEIEQALLHFDDVRSRQRKQPGQVDRALQVEPVVEELGEQMGVAQRLILPAHDAERHEDAAVLGRHAGDDGVHGPLSRSDLVRMAGRENEALPAVLEHHARFRAHKPAAIGVETAN